VVLLAQPKKPSLHVFRAFIRPVAPQDHFTRYRAVTQEEREGPPIGDRQGLELAQTGFPLAILEL
jgi:hypothetical protein